MTQIAKVAVAAATYAIDKPYDYLVPSGMDALRGLPGHGTLRAGQPHRRGHGASAAAGACLPSP